jgi:hypothetical protein
VIETKVFDISAASFYRQLNLGSVCAYCVQVLFGSENVPQLDTIANCERTFAG